ncbi:hypothetical protein [Streptomyces sp. NPDC088775]|uniref:hypothetical protein n=1 Tax=Streptomyces sp. NPDC088775 TaxID=3365896 RepID=UPI0037F9FF88
MTEKMRALRALSIAGECTLFDIVDATGIPSGRTFAALQALLRERCAVSMTRYGHARYTVTDTGRAQVDSWGITAEQETDYA